MHVSIIGRGLNASYLVAGGIHVTGEGDMVTSEDPIGPNRRVSVSLVLNPEDPIGPNRRVSVSLVLNPEDAERIVRPQVTYSGKLASQQEEPLLTHQQWAMLERAEERLYRGESYCHSWTGVLAREDSGMVVPMWEQAYRAIEANEPQQDEDALNRAAARRVAQTLAVLTWGAEWLLK